MNILISITIGVLSGVMTAALIWAIVSIFKKLLIPWYQIKIYRGINVEDDWSGANERGAGIYNHQLSIKQRGHIIKGNLFVENIFGDEKFTSTYSFEGVITDGYLSVRYYPDNKKAIGLGSLLLKVVDRGNGLTGSIMFMDISNTTISSHNDLELKRKQP
jgi:hypothetical protein